MLNLRIVEALDADTLLRQLLKGRVDFTLYERLSLSFQSRRLGILDELEEITHIEEKKVCLGFSALRFGKNRGSFIERINQSISSLQKNGQIEEILLKHGVTVRSTKELTSQD